MSGVSDEQRAWAAGLSTVVLDEDEAAIAAVSVRMYLANLRATYRTNVKRGQEVYAERCIEKFEDALDLYERLGGIPGEVLGIEEVGAP